MNVNSPASRENADLHPLFQHWVDLRATVERQDYNFDDEVDMSDMTVDNTNTKLYYNDGEKRETLTNFKRPCTGYPIEFQGDASSLKTISKTNLKTCPATYNLAIPDLSFHDLRILRTNNSTLEASQQDSKILLSQT